MPDEFKDKISDEDKKTVIDAAKKAEKSLDSDSKDELESAQKELSDKIQEVGAKLYQQQETAGADGEKSETKTTRKKADDDAVEGEVVDEK